MTTFKPRPKQQEVLDYTGGLMGIAAVPGSGKTRTLSYLAARLVATAPMDEDQEVLVVTLVNSAAGNFARQVSQFLKDEYELLPNFGYRVRTLHGLANDIVREKPAQAGLSDGFTIIDDREAADILDDAVRSWVSNHPDSADWYLNEDKLEDEWVRTTRWPDDGVKAIAASFIKQAKNLELTPEGIAAYLDAYNEWLPLAEMCYEIYKDYEHGLRYRGGVDFQDLIRLALKVLRDDATFLARLQHRWPYILEDEAQDSNALQEQTLRMLVGDNGNWVRVGDPNQAIYESFTTANPEFLRNFMREPGVQARELPNSGRSTRSIIYLANGLIKWSLQHPNLAIRERKPLDRPLIEPTPSGDPQGNPPDDPTQIHLRYERFSPDQERDAVVRSIGQWLPQHKDWTCAVLVPMNTSGAKVVGALREAGIDYVENLHTTTSTRAVIGTLTYVLNYLRTPKEAKALANCYRVWRRDDRDDPEVADAIAQIAAAIRKIDHVEDFLWPRLVDWLDDFAGDNPTLHAHLSEFRQIVRRWQQAVALPIDQLILTIAADLFTLENEIATAYSAALHLRRYGETHTHAQLPDFALELEAIARNQRKFAGVSDEETAFDPDAHKGKVTVTTMHKAKGLEWDRVYLMSVNNYDFPSAESFDSFRGEKWFVRDNLNLEAEALAQLDALINGEEYIEGLATQESRIEYATERLRLLYVGITRARRELVITWNNGRKGDQQEAVALSALRAIWEEVVSS